MGLGKGVQAARLGLAVGCCGPSMHAQLESAQASQRTPLERRTAGHACRPTGTEQEPACVDLQATWGCSSAEPCPCKAGPIRGGAASGQRRALTDVDVGGREVGDAGVAGVLGVVRVAGAHHALAHTGPDAVGAHQQVAGEAPPVLSDGRHGLQRQRRGGGWVGGWAEGLVDTTHPGRAGRRALGRSTAGPQATHAGVQAAAAGGGCSLTFLPVSGSVCCS